MCLFYQLRIRFHLVLTGIEQLTVSMVTSNSYSLSVNTVIVYVTSNYTGLSTVATYSVGAQTLTTVSSSLNDIDENTASQYFGVVDNLRMGMTVALDLTWSLTGSSTISYTLNGVSPVIVPSWIILDETNYQLLIDTPSVISNTNYTFNITSASGTYTSNMQIIIEVGSWNDPHWLMCDNTLNIWSSCESSYSLDPALFTWYDPNAASFELNPKFIKSTQTVGIASVSTSSVAGLISSAAAGSSNHGMWASANQYQLYLLLPLLRTGMHNDLIEFFKGLSFFSFSFDFIRIDLIVKINNLLKYFEYGETDQLYSIIEYSYKSSIRNLMSVVFTIWWFFILHVGILMPIRWWMEKLSESNKLRKLFEALYSIFMMGIYLRIYIESLVLQFFTTIYEIYHIETSDTPQIISLSITTCIVLMYFWVFFIYLSYMKKSLNLEFIEEKSILRELISGLKSTKYSRYYFAVFMVKRITSIAIIIFLNSFNVYIRLVWFVTVHSLSVMYSLVVRPFVIAKDNLIEAINDISYTLVVWSLFYFSDSESWSKTTMISLIIFIISISLMVSLISLGYAISIFISKYKKCLNKSQKRNNKVADDATSQSITRRHTMTKYVSNKSIRSYGANEINTSNIRTNVNDSVISTTEMNRIIKSRLMKNDTNFIDAIESLQQHNVFN